MPGKPAQKGVIYIVRCDKYCKIGYTESDPVKRVSALQTGNPFRIELVGTAPGTMDDEQRLHKVFEGKCERGEWFRLEQDDIDRILSNPQLVIATQYPRPTLTPAQQVRLQMKYDTLAKVKAKADDEEAEFMVQLQLLLARRANEKLKAEFIQEVAKIKAGMHGAA